MIHIVGGWTVLHSAVNRGRRKIANLLLRNGANVDAANIYGETSLHWTTVNGNHLKWQPFECYVLLNIINTPSHQLGHERIAQLLISSGANVNAMTVFYRTPLHWAAINGMYRNTRSRIRRFVL